MFMGLSRRACRDLSSSNLVVFGTWIARDAFKVSVYQCFLLLGGPLLYSLLPSLSFRKGIEHLIVHKMNRPTVKGVGSWIKSRFVLWDSSFKIIRYPCVERWISTQKHIDIKSMLIHEYNIQIRALNLSKATSSPHQEETSRQARRDSRSPA